MIDSTLYLYPKYLVLGVGLVSIFAFMKKLIKSMAMSIGIMLTLSSCSSWYQIVTLASRDIEMKDTGAFVAHTGMLSISYDFWSENGNVSFYVTNHSDSDIYLDLSRSYYIWNGKVFDYFLNRTYVTTGGVSSANRQSKSITSASGRTTQPTTYSGAVAPETYASGKGSYMSATVNTDNMQHVTYSNSIEYKEAKIVAIPARSFRSFGEYNVAIGGEYKQCGFVRNPRGKEVSMLNFEEDNSPVVVENRLMFVIDGVDVPISNVFYVSELRNMNSTDVLKYVDLKYCSGRSKRGIMQRNIFSAANRFYIKYTVSDGETGRTR